ENARLKGELQRKAAEAAELEKRQGQLLNELADVSVCLGRERSLQTQLQRALERVSTLERLLRGGSGDAADHAQRVQTLEAEVDKTKQKMELLQQHCVQQIAAMREAVYLILGWDVAYRCGGPEGEETIILQCLYATHDGVLVFSRQQQQQQQKKLEPNYEQPQQLQKQQEEQQEGDKRAGEAAENAEAETAAAAPTASDAAAAAAAADGVAAAPVAGECASSRSEPTPGHTAAPREHSDQQQQLQQQHDSQQEQQKPQHQQQQQQTPQQQQQDEALQRFAKSRYRVSFLNFYGDLLQRDPQLSGRALSQPWPAFAASLCLDELRRLTVSFEGKTPRNIHGMLLPMP
ncbi:hypothetical protein ETH_00009715, partial [Eimeria tenella]